MRLICKFIFLFILINIILLIKIFSKNNYEGIEFSNIIMDKSDNKIPIVIVSHNNPGLLEKLILNLYNDVRGITLDYPIVISLSGENSEIKELASKYNIKLIQNTNNLRKRELILPEHFKFTINSMFELYKNDEIIVLEQDLMLSADTLEFFKATKPLLYKDESIAAVSLFNDNGLKENVNNKLNIRRTNFFPGLGWLCTRKFWGILEHDWPKENWDYYVRRHPKLKHKSYIYPEVSRSFHVAQYGTYMFKELYDAHFRDMELNEGAVTVKDTNVDYLIKENYNQKLLERIKNACEFINGVNNIAVRVKEYECDTVVFVVDDTADDIAQKLNIWRELERSEYHGIQLISKKNGFENIIIRNKNYKKLLKK